MISNHLRRTGNYKIKKSEFQDKGIKLLNHRRAKRKISTLYGDVVYSRSVLIPADEKSKKALLDGYHVKSVFPLDDVLGISRIPFKMTPALMVRCAYWAQNQCSYQAAEDVISDTYGIKVNDDTIRLVTNHIGKIVFEEDCRKANLQYEILEGGKAAFAHDREGVLYIEADGAALNTRHKNDESMRCFSSTLHT